jgi:hypothetical protein
MNPVKLAILIFTNRQRNNPVFNTVAIFMRKRLPTAETYATVMFALFMATIVDTYAGLEFKTWGFFEKDKAEFAALWVILGIIWHENWNLWWSLLLYPFLYYMLILQIYIYRVLITRKLRVKGAAP